MPARNVYVIDGEAARPRGNPSRPAARQKGTTELKARGRAQVPVAGARGGWPRLGASLSIFVACGGHLLHRKWLAGVLYLIGFGSMLALHYALYAAWPSVVAVAASFELGEIDVLFGLLALDIFYVTMLLAAVYSAYAIGYAGREGRSPTAPNPLVPALASLVVPGWGQIVNGQIFKALAFLCVSYAVMLTVAAWVLLPGPLERLLGGLAVPLQPLAAAFVLAIVSSVAWALSLYDGVVVARHRRLDRSR